MAASAGSYVINGSHMFVRDQPVYAVHRQVRSSCCWSCQVVKVG